MSKEKTSDGHSTRSKTGESSAFQELLQLMTQQRLDEAERWKRLDKEREEEHQRLTRMHEEQKELMEIQRKTHAEELKQQRLHTDNLLQSILKEKATLKLQPPQLKPIRPGDDVDAYLTNFEQHLKTYAVPEEKWVSYLRPLLEGQALDALLAVPADPAPDYRQVKKILLQRFGLTQAVYKRRWWSIAFKPGETGLQLANRLVDLSAKHVEDCKTVEECRQSFNIENMLGILPPPIATWIRDKDPKTVQQLGELTDTYLRDRNLDPSMLLKAKRKSDQTRQDQRPAQERHKSAEAPTTTKSSNDSTSEQKQQQKKNLQQYFDPDKGAMCFNCHEWGYIGVDCPKKVCLVTAKGLLGYWSNQWSGVDQIEVGLRGTTHSRQCQDRDQR